MKKKVLAVMMAAVMLGPASVYAGEPAAQEQTENNGENTAEEQDPAEEAGSAETEDYGMTEEQVAALVDSVKTSVTENYLEKYGIAPADFQMNPYDGNDMNNYTMSGEYTGSDPYQWSKIWYNVDRDLIKADSDMEMSLMVNAFTEGDGITLEMAVEDIGDVVFPDDSESCSALFDNPQTADLMNAVYKGIAAFLNGLDGEAKTEVLLKRYGMAANSEKVKVFINENEYMEQQSETMFDKVICENIKFE